MFTCFPSSSAGKQSAAMQETLVQLLGQEDPLEEGMATHSSVLAGKIPEKLGWLWSIGLQRIGHKQLTPTTRAGHQC